MKTHPRVLMTADVVGGVWTYATELAHALPSVEFAFATMGSPVSENQRLEVEELGNATLFTSTFALEWMDDPWEEVDQAGEWLLQIASEFGADLVHLNGYSHALLPWQIPVMVVAHSCVLSWWAAVKRCDAPAHYREYRRRVSGGLNAADMVIAPTAAMLKSLHVHYGFFGDGTVIANARDPEQFSPSEKRPVVFSAGRLWDEAKNLAALEAVAPRLRWPIEVAGDALHPNGSTTEFRNICSLGQLSSAAMAERLSTSAVYALPARYEPFGLSVLEAALSGCALVLGDIASLREVWGDAAVYVTPDDHDALATALNDLIGNELLRTEMAERALTRASLYSPDQMAQSYDGIYDGLLAEIATA